MGSKKTKRMIGIALAFIGVIMIIFSFYEMHRISGAKSEVHSITSPFSGNPAGKRIGGALESEASQYDSKVMMLLIGGIVVTLVGCSLVFFSRKK